MKKGDIVYLLASDEGGVKGSLIALTWSLSKYTTPSFIAALRLNDNRLILDPLIMGWRDCRIATKSECCKLFDSLIEHHVIHEQRFEWISSDSLIKEIFDNIVIFNNKNKEVFTGVNHISDNGTIFFGNGI